jgi:hypothetical protein
LQHAFTARGCIFKEITLVGSNQRNYLENATSCSKRSMKTRVATQLNIQKSKEHKIILLLNGRNIRIPNDHFNRIQAFLKPI